MNTYTWLSFDPCPSCMRNAIFPFVLSFSSAVFWRCCFFLCVKNFTCQTWKPIVTTCPFEMHIDYCLYCNFHNCWFHNCFGHNTNTLDKITVFLPIWIRFSFWVCNTIETKYDQVRKTTHSKIYTHTHRFLRESDLMCFISNIFNGTWMWTYCNA